MKIKKHKRLNTKIILILSEKELEYLKLEIGDHNESYNSSLYYHFCYDDYCAIIDINMIPMIMDEIELLYQDKITLCKLYEILNKKEFL